MQESFSHTAINILSRLKSALNLHKDGDLAKVINTAQNTISSWKKRDSVDYKVIIAICEKNGLDLAYILTGKEPETPYIVSESSNQYGKDDEAYYKLLIESLQMRVKSLESLNATLSTNNEELQTNYNKILTMLQKAHSSRKTAMPIIKKPTHKK